MSQSAFRRRVSVPSSVPVILPAGLALFIAACACAQPLPGGRLAQASRAALAGKWVATVGDGEVTLELAGDGKAVLDGTAGNYSAEPGKLALEFGEGVNAYTFKLAATS